MLCSMSSFGGSKFCTWLDFDDDDVGDAVVVVGDIVALTLCSCRCCCKDSLYRINRLSLSKQSSYFTFRSSSAFFNSETLMVLRVRRTSSFVEIVVVVALTSQDVVGTSSSDCVSEDEAASDDIVLFGRNVEDW